MRLTVAAETNESAQMMEFGLRENEDASGFYDCMLLRVDNASLLFRCKKAIP